jgi:hypothetical protein
VGGADVPWITPAIGQWPDTLQPLNVYWSWAKIKLPKVTGLVRAVWKKAGAAPGWKTTFIIAND